MLTHKLLAALGLAGALMFGATTDASANPWRGPHFRPAPVYSAPVYRAPIYRAPFMWGPTYAPVYRAPVVYAPTYAPIYSGVGWRHPGWVGSHGHPW